MHDGSGSQVRWAALGAAVAITLGAGGISLANAGTGGGERTVFVPINPCRLADSRPDDFHTGTIAAAIGEDTAVSVAARGPQGDCELDDEATGLVLNVTAVDPTRATFLTLWPTAAERPRASNLNPAPGQPPTPNAVTVDLDDDGRFSIYNRFGAVHVVVDVVGYYADHDHDDRYYTKAEVDARLAEPTSLTIDGYTGFVVSVADAGRDVENNYCVRGRPWSGATQPGGLWATAPLPAGAEVTGLTINTFSEIAQPFTVSLAAFAGVDDGRSLVSSAIVRTSGPGESTEEIPVTPTQLAAGERLRVFFHSHTLASTTSVCSVEIHYR